MSLLTTLLSQGFTLPGQDANVIEEPGGTPQIGGDISPLARVNRYLQAQFAKKKMDDAERQKKMDDQLDTYKTLRQSGYSPAKAHAAVISGNLPKDIPEGPDAAGSTIDKTVADTAKVKAETEVVGEVGS